MFSIMKCPIWKFKSVQNLGLLPLCADHSIWLWELWEGKDATLATLNLVWARYFPTSFKAVKQCHSTQPSIGVNDLSSDSSETSLVKLKDSQTV